jgi:hypothetical protein
VQLDWPVEDVEKNVSYFLQSVKRATGNTKEAEAEMKRTGNFKPSRCLPLSTIPVADVAFQRMLSPVSSSPQRMAPAFSSLFRFILIASNIGESIYYG